MTVTPDPVLPTYSGANVRGIVPTLLAPGRDRLRRPAWFPESAWMARAVVLLVIDGLGWEQLRERAALAPNLTALQGGPITTVAPSTTATALTSITTGLTPGEHGLVGYRIEIAGEVVNLLRWASAHGDVRRSVEPAVTQPFAPFLGDSPPVVSRADLEGTAFTEAHLRGSRPRGWRLASGLPVTVATLVAEGERFVYAYYDGIDKVAHERGFGDHYDAELVAVDRMVGDLADRLPSGTALLVTADHGQVEVGDRIVDPHPEVRRLCRQQSGEGRFRWLHARTGAAGDLLTAAREHHGSAAWVHSRDELIAAGWFGPVVSPPIAARYGDVAMVPFDPVSFHDPADSGPHALICRHGSLTAAEMLVPLLCNVS